MIINDVKHDLVI